MAQSVVPIVFLFGTGVERAQELWVGKIDGQVELPLAEQAGHRHEELPVPRVSKNPGRAARVVGAIAEGEGRGGRDRRRGDGRAA